MPFFLISMDFVKVAAQVEMFDNSNFFFPIQVSL